ncbi:MAG: insulinase family protein [Motiliproteus sp.]
MSCHASFQRLRSRPLAALNIDVQEFRHLKTGALHYHMAAPGNPENVFLVALRTPPTDSRGAAHVLEHCVLCGSERYPVRDPYFLMRKRSLATYMNAFTSADWTAYSFASQNQNDYFNLLDIYLDAVFFANLNPLDFAQEGYRLAVNDAGQLEHRGVVFNEMKGVFNTPTSVHWETLCKYLFPTTPYRFVSGGDPQEIPNLTHEQLLDFYQKHYHPSNAVFMTFGDIPAAELQQRIDQQVLCRFDQRDPLLTFGAVETRYQTPVKRQESVAVAAVDNAALENKQTHHLLAWLMGQSTDLRQLLEVHLLSRLLFQDSAAPLLQALETTELGTAPSPLCGMEDGNLEISFVCGLQGCDPESADRFESLVLSTLQKIADQGVDKELLDAVLHQLELEQREMSDDSYPYGLQLILSALPAALHLGADGDRDPMELLDLEPVMAQLREAIKDPEYIKRLVRQRLLDNPHRVRLSLVPDAELNQRRQQAEKEQLGALLDSFSKQQYQRLIEQADALEARQDQEEDVSVLPTLSIKDIPADLKAPVSNVFTSPAGMPITCFEQGTNGLIHQQLVIDMPYLEEELLQVLPYYSACLTELGCGQRDYLQEQAWQSCHSGGINASSNVRGSLLDVQQVKGYFTFATRGLAKNHRALSDMLYEGLTAARFDEHQRIRNIITQKRLAADAYVMDNGHVLAKRTASSGFSPAAFLTHRLSGLKGIQSLRALDDRLREGSDADQLIEAMAEKFRRIHSRLLSAPRQFLLVGDKEGLEQQRRDLFEVWQGSDTEGITDFRPFELEPVAHQVREIWTADTQVNFCSIAYPTVAIDHPDAVALHVLGELVRHEYLHPVVRERGGAYGSGCSQDSNIGAFRMCSYRDPRCVETLEDFGWVTQWLASREQTQQQLDDAVLAMISYMDKPVSPGNEAKQVFHNALYGRTTEQRRGLRERILSVTREDLVRVRETYLVPERANMAVITRSSDPIVQWAGEKVFETIKL